MSVDTKLILKLRNLTGAGVSDCQNALEEAKNNIVAAIEILRKKGAVKAAKKAERDAREGIIQIALSDDKKTGSMVQVHCESDFVAKNNEFISFVASIAQEGLTKSAEKIFLGKKNDIILKIGENITFGKSEVLRGEYVDGYVHATKKIACLVAFSEKISPDIAHDIALQITAAFPLYVSQNDVPNEVKNKEMEIYREQIRQEKKPEAIIDKIAAGKLQKFFQENCLLLQPFVKDDSITVAQYLQKNNIKTEKLMKFVRYQI